MILYFSGTGNSLYAAKLISKITGDELVSLNERIKRVNYEDIHSDKPLIFICPTYAWNIPHIVKDFILKTKFTGSNKAYFILTCGSETGGAAYKLNKICMEKQFEFMGLASIIMPENYLALFPVPDEVKSIAIINNAVLEIKRTAEIISAEKNLETATSLISGLIVSSLVTSAFYKFIVSDNGFHTDSRCIGCGLCAKLCSLNNIQIKDKKPVWNGSCTHCMACICSCPKEAIEYKNKTTGKRRYLCTEEPNL